MQRLVETAGRGLRRFYPLLFAFVFLAYIGIATLAPVCMHNGKESLGKGIYTLYRFCCHQFPYRSFFLYGEQSFYPLETAKIEGIRSYESIGFEGKPVKFLGNSRIGWKMAVCQRDTALWTAMGLFCILFCLCGNRAPWISVHVWLLLGVLPMALDGGTQAVSRLFTVRESTPLIRVITGALFGFMTCWFLFPRLESSLRKGAEDKGAEDDNA